MYFPALGAGLNVLAQEQADYIGFTVEAPFQGWTLPLSNCKVHIVTLDHMKKLKNIPLVGNTGQGVSKLKETAEIEDYNRRRALQFALPGARVFVTECDPFCALLACMEGIETVVSEIDTLVSSTGNLNIVTFGPHEEVEEQCGRCKHPTFFDNTIDFSGFDLSAPPLWPALSSSPG